MRYRRPERVWSARGRRRPVGGSPPWSESPDQKDTIRTLRKEINRLNNEVVRRDKQILQLNKRLDQEKESTESIRETARKLSSESLRLHREVRILGDSEARARSLSDEVFWLRLALEVSKAGQEKLKARLVKLRAAGVTLSKLAGADHGAATAHSHSLSPLGAEGTGTGATTPIDLKPRRNEQDQTMRSPLTRRA